MIDWDQVDELRADMGEGFDEVVEVFLQEVEGGLERLDPAAGAAAVAAEMHFLKGAALNLGFRAFARLCAEGEASANAGKVAGEDLDAVRSAYTESREAFMAGLSRRAA